MGYRHLQITNILNQEIPCEKSRKTIAIDVENSLRRGCKRAGNLFLGQKQQAKVKMIVLMRSMQEVSHFESMLEMLCVASIAFEDMVALLMENNQRNKEEAAATPITNAFASTSSHPIL